MSAHLITCADEFELAVRLAIMDLDSWEHSFFYDALEKVMVAISQGQADPEFQPTRAQCLVGNMLLNMVEFST